MGLEPTTFGSEVRRAIHYATKPYVKTLSNSTLIYRSSSDVNAGCDHQDYIDFPLA